MRLSDKGLRALMGFEGLRLNAYRDSGGTLTIGVGHTSAAGPPKVTAGMTITEAEAMEILRRDLMQYEAAVARRLVDVPQHVYDGAVSFCYNLGPGAFEKAAWVAEYKSGNMAAAERSLKSWHHVGGRDITGLIRRRNLEADMIFRGVYPGDKPEQPLQKTSTTPAPPIKLPSSTTAKPAAVATVAVAATGVAAITAGNYWWVPVLALIAVGGGTLIIMQVRK